MVEPGATASAASVIAGGSVTISGVGFAPGETVDVTLSSTPVALGSFTADDAGAVEAPSSSRRTSSRGCTPSRWWDRPRASRHRVEIEVVAPAPVPGAAAELPPTGSAAGELTLIGPGSSPPAPPSLR